MKTVRGNIRCYYSNPTQCISIDNSFLSRYKPSVFFKYLSQIHAVQQILLNMRDATVSTTLVVRRMKCVINCLIWFIGQLLIY